MSKDGNCTAKIPTPDGWGTYRCSRKAVRDGFCTQHHPDSKKARLEATNAKYKREDALAKARWDVKTAGHTVIAVAVKTVSEEIEYAELVMVVGHYNEMVNRLKALEENENV